MVTKVTLVPSLNLGVIVLTNAESGKAFESITYSFLDGYMNKPLKDWVDYFVPLAQETQASAQEVIQKRLNKRNVNSKPSLPLSEYCGIYRDCWYGDISITKKGEIIELSFSRTPSLVGPLEHWHYDTFLVKWYKRELNADAFLTFSLSLDGDVEQLKMLPYSPLVDFSYDYQHLLFSKVQ